MIDGCLLLFGLSGILGLFLIGTGLTYLFFPEYRQEIISDLFGK